MTYLRIHAHEHNLIGGKWTIFSTHFAEFKSSFRTINIRPSNERCETFLSIVSISPEQMNRPSWTTVSLIDGIGSQESTGFGEWKVRKKELFPFDNFFGNIFGYWERDSCWYFRCCYFVSWKENVRISVGRLRLTIVAMNSIPCAADTIPSLKYDSFLVLFANILVN